MSATLTKALIIVGALALFVLLFIYAPKTKPVTSNNSEKDKSTSFASANIELYVNMAKKTLSPEQKEMSDRLEQKKNFDSLAIFWDKSKRPDIASFFVEEKARVLASSDAWNKAGNRYYYAVQFSEDKSEIPLLYQCAMRCLNKSLSLDPKNNEAKILLASCYVEGTQSPMDGITLLREVEQSDSNNVKLQLAFAFFSVKSGQLDRAITRFKKVLKLDSNYVEAYLHLADAFEQRGETEKAIDMLQLYSGKSPDITVRMEIDKYIQQLKSNINK